jgi:uridine kinase
MIAHPTIIGIAGGSGSGKTTLARELVNAMHCSSCLILSQDYYYRDRSDLTLAERQHINYDHPDAIEFDLLVDHLQNLRQGKTIFHPLYDFSQHNRRPEHVLAGPAELVVVDGILLFAVQDILPLFDLKIFIETAMDIAFIRRLQRDTQERGRTIPSVIEQYLATVRPMYLQFVQPSRAHADLVVSGEEEISLTIDRIMTRYIQTK